MTPGLAARTAAWRVLHDIRRNIPFDRALEHALVGLSEPDGRLAHELAAGVLRHRTGLDAAISPFVDGGAAKVRDDLLDILRLGAYQLLYLERVPGHAAVDTSVELGRRIAGNRVGGFVNAVLRRVSEAGVPAPDAPADRGAALAAQYSHPGWLVERWIRQFGPDDTERLLTANNARPPLVVQPARWSLDALVTAFDQQGITWRPASFDAGLVVTGRRPTELPGFAAGSCVVQDPAQALVLRYFAPAPGALSYDACAAPGGKSVALSATSGYVLAADLRPARAHRLQENITRAAIGPAGVVVADASAPPLRSADQVLFDAPCLGTGTFSRHPDARWRVTPEALAELAAQAARILPRLASTVAPGGLLFFSTCSLEPEENALQVEAFLAGDSRFRREPVATLPGTLLTPAGDLLLLPHRDGTDGAYAARLRRVA